MTPEGASDPQATLHTAATPYGGGATADMSDELLILGGSEEIGANCCYIKIQGVGLLIDSGLHPQKRNELAFPLIRHVEDKPTDALVITHAHSDHIGGIPYVLQALPHLRIVMTQPTRDLAEIMLRNSFKLLRKDNLTDFSQDVLALYNKETLQRLGMIFEGFRYRRPIRVFGKRTDKTVDVTLYPAGHILGAAGVLIESGGISVMHTGDVLFTGQSWLSGAELPTRHVDCLIIECTNGATDNVPSLADERRALAHYINAISNAGGSILIPAFALGKSQELLTMLYRMMRANEIPHLPLYTGGLCRKISRVYDVYCYAAPNINPGFEISDIPQIPLDYDKLLNDKYFTTPSIVLATSGMINPGTVSHTLAQRWFRHANFGIALIGYQQEDAPGYALLRSEKGRPFLFGASSHRRSCDVRHFRLSAHANRNDLLRYIADVRPKSLYLVHGDSEACEWIGRETMERLPQTKVCIPALGKPYALAFS